MSVFPTSSEVKVAVGLPVYNGERYLEETLRSVLNQTYGDFQLIIADNASTDRTEAICRDYARQDPRIHYLRNTANLGASKNYACCFHPARAPYFRWQNADDPIEPRLIERCMAVLDAEPEVVLAYGKSKILDENGRVTSDYEDNLNLTNLNAGERFIECIRNIGLQNLMYGLIRRDILARTALLGNYLASDINLIGELSLYGQFREVPEHLFNRRMHPEASSWDRKDPERQKNFWDPSKRKLVMQTWRSIYEFYKATYRAPIPVKDKLHISGFLMKRAYWHKSYMKNELVDMIRFGIMKG